jgi:spore maturation protein CgeB
MKIAIFGLAVSSAWGNGHATLWRGLCQALAAMKHQVIFFEQDAPYYATHRDLASPDGWKLCLYSAWDEVCARAERELADADVGLVTSYCPDGVAATELVLSSRARVRCFYDLDTPVTLQRLGAGEQVPYLGSRRLAGFDLVLSYTGGAALTELETRLGAVRTAPLHGGVDPRIHRPVEATGRVYLGSYLGTYAQDRQHLLDQLLLAPARRMPERSFALGGSLYPAAIEWPANVHFRPHVPPAEHPAFYCSASLSINVTRAAMARMGYCPSARLFESAACGVPVLSDWWEGLDRFFEPGREILVARSTDEALDAMRRPAAELAQIGRAARRRALAEHTAAARARELVRLVDGISGISSISSISAAAPAAPATSGTAGGHSMRT